MDEITLKISVEQYTIIQKVLEPYVKTSVNLANQFKIQQDLFGKKIKEEVKEQQ